MSYASLSRAAAGKKLPTWQVTHGFVRACGADPDEWEAPWEAARARGGRSSLFDRPVTAPLPDPATVRTVADLRSAVTEILRSHDVGVVSATMREQLSKVRFLSRRPEQTDEATFERFLRACGADDDDADAWTDAWRSIRATLRHQQPAVPDPDRVDTEGDVGRWLAAQERAVETQVRRETLVDATVAGPRSLGVDEYTAAAEPLWRRTLPDPAEAGSYDDLVTAMQRLRGSAGVSAGDIELRSGGRLGASRATAILDGVLPASGEEVVLLLRACGLRDEIDGWIEAWLRLDGATLGQSSAGARPRRAAGPATIELHAMVGAIVLIGLLAAVLAWLV